MYPKSYLFYNTIRDCYEAYVLYIFMKLLVIYFGGEISLNTYLGHKRYIHHLWPFNKMLSPIRMNQNFYLTFKKGVLQFVFIKPLTSIIALILDYWGLYQEGDFNFNSPYLYLSFVNNFSVSLSLYSLGLFYMATEERLIPHEPFSKFLCIKAIIFFSYWQSCMFTVLMKFNVINDIIRVNESHNLIISLEIVLAALAQSQAFSYKNYQTDENNSKKSLLSAIDEVFTIKDVFIDAQSTFLKEEDYGVVRTEMHEIKVREVSPPMSV